MGLIECASGASIRRGYDYYKAEHVKELTVNGDRCFSALVVGNGKNPYKVSIDVQHIRSSRCNCPHAYGKSIICKHMIATYFTAFPEEAEKVYIDILKPQDDAELYEEELYSRVIDHIERMSKCELQQALLDMLYDAPEWLFNRFISEYGIDDF